VCAVSAHMLQAVCSRFLAMCDQIHLFTCDPHTVDKLFRHFRAPFQLLDSISEFKVWLFLDPEECGNQVVQTLLDNVSQSFT
jgi:hypothetical protein